MSDGKQIDRGPGLGLERGCAGESWAPLAYGAAGISEIAPRDVAPRVDDVQILDVREPTEFSGPLGHIRGAILIPLGELPRRTGELSHQRPIVVVCHSGARSAKATMLLRQVGFRDVANMSGGMVRWKVEGLPVI